MKSSTTRVKTPIQYSNNYFNELHNTKGSTVIEYKFELESKMGFKCRQGIGELLFVAMKYCPGIMYAVMKLSQFSLFQVEI